MSLDVPPAEHFAVQLPFTTPSEQAAASDGAGNLETVGAQDEYTFTLGSSAALVLDATSCLSGLTAVLVNTATNEKTTLSTSSRDIVTPTMPAGDYRLDVTANTAGTYALSMLTVPDPQVFDYEVGSTVSNGVPGVGAGNLETIASIDRYLFTVPEGGLALQYQRLSGSKDYRVINQATGTVVASGWNDQRFALPPGDYRVEFPAQAAGTYSWRLFVV